MKKLVLTLALLLTTILTFGQSIQYLRAKSFQLGYKVENSDIEWDKSSLSDCDILIKLGESEFTVYSKTPQKYQVIRFDGKMKNGASRWYCSNSDGKTCNVYLMPPQGESTYPSLVIEFSDMVWFYVCKIVD